MVVERLGLENKGRDIRAGNNRAAADWNACPYERLCTSCTADYENLHHNKMMMMKTTAANGAYCRIIAWILMFRAALRYFSDSERRDVDR